MQTAFLWLLQALPNFDFYYGNGFWRMCQTHKWLKTINAPSLHQPSFYRRIIPKIDAIMTTAVNYSHTPTRDREFPERTAADLFIPSFMTAGSYV